MADPPPLDALLLERSAGFWLEQGGGVLPTSGSSMRPTFEDTARVWIERGQRARFGDVLVYRSASLLVVHRVVSLVPRVVIRTKGDGLPHLDLDRVTADRILGRVVEIQRGEARYRVDGIGGGLYAKAIAGVSALEGFCYRAAWRLDRALGPARRERPLFRAVVTRSGRLACRLLDRALFRVLNARVPS